VQQTSPEEAYRKFEEMGSKQIDTLRKLTKEVMKKIQNSNILSKILKYLYIKRFKKSEKVTKKKLLKKPYSTTMRI
jgi:hypothetical protein